MNNETAVLIALGIAVFVIALVFGFSQGVTDQVEQFIIGGEDEDGVIECGPDNLEACPSNGTEGTEETSTETITGEVAAA